MAVPGLIFPKKRLDGNAGNFFDRAAGQFFRNWVQRIHAIMWKKHKAEVRKAEHGRSEQGGVQKSLESRNTYGLNIFNPLVYF